MKVGDRVQSCDALGQFGTVVDVVPDLFKNYSVYVKWDVGGSTEWVSRNRLSVYSPTMFDFVPGDRVSHSSGRSGVVVTANFSDPQDIFVDFGEVTTNREWVRSNTIIKVPPPPSPSFKVGDLVMQVGKNRGGNFYGVGDIGHIGSGDNGSGLVWVHWSKGGDSWISPESLAHHLPVPQEKPASSEPAIEERYLRAAAALRGGDVDELLDVAHKIRDAGL